MLRAAWNPNPSPYSAGVALGMVTRELIGRIGQSGWRPSLIGWGLGSALVALAWAIVFRFALGAASLTDLAALVAAGVPLVQYIRLRGAPSQPSPTGGLVNNEALA
jgi:hypothetical protein